MPWGGERIMTKFERRPRARARGYFPQMLAAIPAIAVLGWASIAAAAPPATCAGCTRVIGPGDVWKYEDNGVDFQDNWLPVGFDDSTWASGHAQFGYGDGDEVTLTREVHNGTPDPVFPSYYFRKTIDILAP